MEQTVRTPGWSVKPAQLPSIARISRDVRGGSARRARLENPTASAWSLSRSKRLLDLAVALAVLAAFGLPLLLIALCVRLTSPGPAFFSQHRVGRNNRLFRIYKFRSMTVDSGPSTGPGLTRDGDSRVTSIGRWLRRLKLDELPQFYNILRGDMSLVGPRPKLQQYAGIVNMPFRPGITGAATIAFRHEERLLGNIPPGEMDIFYDQWIRPLKAHMDVPYMSRATFWSDLRLIGATLLGCFSPARTPALLQAAWPRVMAFPPQSATESRPINSFETAG